MCTLGKGSSFFLMVYKTLIRALTLVAALAFMAVGTAEASSYCPGDGDMPEGPTTFCPGDDEGPSEPSSFYCPGDEEGPSEPSS